MELQKYSYEESRVASKNYFNGDELATKVFLDKYALRNEAGDFLEKTPEDMHHRLASEFARIEKKKFKNPISEEEAFSYFDKFKYIVPQGSPMYGIGNNHSITSLSNCYVLETPEDSYGSIMKTDEQLVQISKRRGGVGIDLSRIRPINSPTKNSARSSTGIVPFMERYSNSIREVGQQQRRGALMLTLSVHHPEVMNFITVKNDRTKVTGANVSLKLTREFFDAVKNDKEYELRFPVDYKESGMTPLVSQTIKAQDVWRAIIKNAHHHAEPGLLMWDNILEYGPADYYQEYRSVSTNPCLPCWAKLLTPSGIRELKDINIGDMIWSSEGWTRVVNKFSAGIKEVFRYSTTSGAFYGTKDHRIISHGESIPVGEANTIDFITGEYHKCNNFNIQDVMDGLVIGDGTVHKASGNLVLLCIGENDKDYFTSEISSLIVRSRLETQDYGYEVITNIKHTELPYTYLRCIPNKYKFGNKEKVIGFLRGLYSANGSVTGEKVTLKATSFRMIEDVQLMLSSIGIHSYYTTNKSKSIRFSNGEYVCKESYDLNITRDKIKFIENIGFIQKYKMEKLENIIKKQDKCDKHRKISYDIKDIEYISEEEVFDITVDNTTHTFWCGSASVSNCSEIPLSSFDSCRLICMNLLSYVRNPFRENASFDYKKFYEYAKVAQRFMDDMVDLESEKIDRIIAKIKDDPESMEIKDRELKLWQKIKKFNDEGRRTGTGITALGDTLAALGIKYGSEESVKKTEKIYRTLKLACYESSVEMAEELGAFKCWDYEKEKENPYLLRINDENPELYKRMKKSGRRNISLTTTAPTGSLSILTQTSSGIEPVFQLSYIRRKKINVGSDNKNEKVDFIDQTGDQWQEFQVYHPQLKNWMEITKETDEKKSPWFECCAEDINWINRVKLQVAAQMHVCHAISSTINLPENVSEETVSKIYTTAFESGLKGLTIYRKNCRTGVLVDNNKNIVDKIQQTKAHKRPKELKCEIHHFNLNKQKYYVVVGLWSSEEPYEVFTGINHNDEGDTIIPKIVKAGSIVKEARGKYVLVSDDQTWLLTNGHHDENADVLTRMLSCSLRHGVPIQFVIDQLSKTKGSLISFSKILARVLKKYITIEVNSSENCPNCQAKLVYSEGCKKCYDCSWTVCG